MKAMILAAGLGTRLRPYTLKRPKPLFPVLGQPLLLRLIDQLRAAGFGPIVVNAFHLAEQVVSLVGKFPDVILQREPIELGTGGGLRLARGHFGDEPVLLTNGDIYHDIDYRQVMDRHRQGGCPVTMVMHDYPRFNKVPVRDGKVVGFTADLAPAERDAVRTLAFTGIHVLEPSILDPIPSGTFYSIITRYQEHLQAGGQIQGVTVEGHFWRDMGTLADYLALHQTLLSGRSPSFVVANNVDVAPDVELADWGFVGSGVSIGARSKLSRVVAWDGAVIPSDSILHDCLVT